MSQGSHPPATHRQIGSPLSGHVGSVNSVAFSRDRKTLATGADDKVRLWDVATHRQIGNPMVAGDPSFSSVDSVAFSRDGETLASSSEDDMVRLWDVATSRQIRPALTVHIFKVATVVAFSPDGTSLATKEHGGAVVGCGHPPPDRRPHRPHWRGAIGGVQPGRHDAGHQR